MSNKLLGVVGGGRMWAPAMVAAVGGVEMTSVTINIGKDNETPAWTSNCSPFQRVPVLELPCGSCVFESGAIIRALARQSKIKGYYEGDNVTVSKIDSWIDATNTEFLANALPLFYDGKFGPAMSEDEYASKMQALHWSVASLETFLENKTYLVGERVTAADASLYGALIFVLGKLRQSSEFWKYKNVVRYAHTIYYNNAGIAAAAKSQGDDGAALVKPAEYKAPKKVEEKPKPAAAAASAAAEEEPKPEENKKKPGWQLEALPESKGFLGQGLDEWKRQYSNVKDTAKSTAWLFDNFDADGYTMWFCKYKYNEECKMQFQTANLTRGWFQRMEGVRKYAFGTALILGEATNHEIQGHWIFRQGGNMQEKQGFDGLPECIREVEDISLYEWKQIDVKNISADEKLLIQNFLEWDGKALPRPCLEGRTFK